MGCVRGGGQGRECLSVEIRKMGVAVGLSISRRTWIFLDASPWYSKSRISTVPSPHMGCYKDFNVEY